MVFTSLPRGALSYGYYRATEARRRAKKKAEMKESAAADKLYKQKVAEEKRVARQREKEERAQVKAKKAEEAAERKAEREHQKQARDTQKAIQLSRRGNCTTSQASAAKKKPRRGAVGARSHPKPATPPRELPSRTTRHGRTSTLPQRFV